MALAAIEEIKKAEEKAESMLIEASESAKETVRNSKVQAENEYNTIIENARAKQVKLMEEAETEGQKQAEPVLAQGEGDVSKIKNISQEKKDNAIKLIVERIVKIHGNS